MLVLYVEQREVKMVFLYKILIMIGLIMGHCWIDFYYEQQKGEYTKFASAFWKVYYLIIALMLWCI